MMKLKCTNIFSSNSFLTLIMIYKVIVYGKRHLARIKHIVRKIHSVQKLETSCEKLISSSVLRSILTPDLYCLH